MQLANRISHSIKSIYDRRLLIAALLVALSASAQAQQLTKSPRIGFLSTNSRESMSIRTEAFLSGLRALGYVDGKNIRIEYRYAAGKLDRLPTLAAELVGLNLDLIVAAGGNATASASKQASSKIPIVVTNVLDPVGSGLISSLARPGGNLTGLSGVSEDLAGKRLELIKETFPKVSPIAVLLDPEDQSKIVELKQVQAAAKVLEVNLQAIEVRSSGDFPSAFKAATKERAGAFLVLQSAVTNTGRKAIVELATKNRLPTMWAESGLMDAGGLMSYGPNYADLFRRAATYVDKILKGAKPADLPVEQPTKFEFIINLKAAKQIGLTIPPNVLARADKVIK
jgi:ABC-type uncharacterized transport system substrate-binding protein